MTQGRKPYKKSLKVRSRTGPKAKARTGGRTRKLRSQRRSRKHKKYPKKKYLGGLHPVTQENNKNCTAHATSRCIYRICKDYEVIIPGTEPPRAVPKTPTVGSEYDKQIADDQRLVYFTLLPIITYFVYILKREPKENFDKDPMDESYTNDYIDYILLHSFSPPVFINNYLFRQECEIFDDDMNQIISNHQYFKVFNTKDFTISDPHILDTISDKDILEMANKDTVYNQPSVEQLSDDEKKDLIRKQLHDFNALTKNLRIALNNKNKMIHYNKYSLDDYMVNKSDIYGILSYRKFYSEDMIVRHSVTINDIEKKDNRVYITVKDTSPNYAKVVHPSKVDGMKNIISKDITRSNKESTKVMQFNPDDIEDKRKIIRDIIDIVRGKNKGKIIVRTSILSEILEKEENEKQLQKELEEKKTELKKLRKELNKAENAFDTAWKSPPPNPPPNDLQNKTDYVNELSSTFSKLKEAISDLENQLNDLSKSIQGLHKNVDNSISHNNITQQILTNFKDTETDNWNAKLLGFTVEDLPPSDTP